MKILTKLVRLKRTVRVVAKDTLTEQVGIIRAALFTQRQQG